MSFESVLETINALTGESVVGICAHTRPDGDAVGSVLALAHALDSSGIKAVPLLADETSAPATYAWLHGFPLYEMPSQTVATHFNLLIVVDTPNVARLSGGSAYLHRSDASLLIDHHPPLDRYTDTAWIDVEYAASAQLVWALLKASRYECAPAVATACYAGLISDTGRFQHVNTTSRVLRDAADMVDGGADPSSISTRLFNSKSLAVLELESLILAKLAVTNGGYVAYSVVSDEDYSVTGASKAEGENLIELIRALDGIRVAILFSKTAQGVRVSLRSKSDFDVSSVAHTFGGGGHKAAAGITWPDSKASVETVLSSILPLLPRP
ncbi:MAG: DHH family phosphoesterase [Coriobacteriia bacterium]|nr:DHH family phosphoesterase [Coriobacteriia bacterium]